MANRPYNPGSIRRENSETSDNQDFSFSSSGFKPDARRADVTRPLLVQQQHITIPLDFSAQGTATSPTVKGSVTINAAPTQHTFNVPVMGRVLFILACVNGIIEITADIFYLCSFPRNPDDPDMMDNWNTLLYSLVLSCILVPFLILFLWTSIMFENKFEMVSFVVASALITFHSWWQLWRHNISDKSHSDISSTLGTIVFAGALVSSLFCVAFCALSWYVCSQFGWHVYKRVGANNVLINMFTRFQIFKSLLKVDLMWALVLLLTGLFARVWDTVWGVSLTIIMIFASVSWVFALTSAVRNEHNKLFWMLLPFAFAEPVYIFYKLYQVLEHGDDNGNANVNPLLDIIPHVTFTTPYYGALAGGAIVVRAALLVMSWHCKQNFNKGLLADVLSKPGVRGVFWGRK